MGDRLYVDGFELSGDIGSLETISGGPEALVTTGIDKSAMERLGGKRDGHIEFTAFFNPATNRAHPVLNDLPTTDRQVTYIRGGAAGAESASLLAKQIGYDATRGEDGSLTFKVAAEGQGFGLEWGEVLAFLLQGAPGSTAGLDNGAGTAFGLQAYLHVVAFSGTSATIAIQESTDNGGGDPYANVPNGVFAAVSGLGTQRIATPNNQAIERWLRLNTTGTFSSLACIVTVVRNPIAGQVF
jgi:hypothetical protein